MQATAAASWDPWEFQAAPWGVGQRRGQLAEAGQGWAPGKTCVLEELQPIPHHEQPFFPFCCSYTDADLHITALPSSLMFIQIYTSQPFLSAVHTDLHITALPFYCSYRSTHHSSSFCSAVHTDLHIMALPFYCSYRSTHHSHCCSYRSTHHSCSFLSAVHTLIQIYTSQPFLCAYHTDLHATAVLSFLILIQLFCSHSSSNWTEAFQKQKERKKLNADLPHHKHVLYKL